MFKKPKIPHTKLNEKIDWLDYKINHNLIGIGKADWKEVSRLSEKIFQAFKNCHYPTQQEQEVAWRRFQDIREKGKKEQDRLYKARSNEHFKAIQGLLFGLDYSFLRDEIFIFNKDDVDSMKQKGRLLKEAGQHFTSVKYEMTREDKAIIYEKIVAIRESHDNFWGQYKEHSDALYKQRKAEKQKAWEENQKAWEEKQEKSRRVRARIEGNLEKNKERLRKSSDFLNKLENQRSDLQSKIWESSNPNWKSKAEDWLSEKDDKIRDVEQQINQLRDWIQEDEDKLAGWN